MLNVTLSIVAFLLGAFIAFVVSQNKKFDKNVEEDVNDLRRRSGQAPRRKISYEQLAGLPKPVQRYLRYAVKNGQERPNLVRMKHDGTFRNYPNHNWLSIEGEQYYLIEEPAFIWYATLKLNPISWIKARDKYDAGKGNMLIKLLSAIPMGNATGDPMDISSLLRFLSEMPLFPAAFLESDYLEWEGIDSQSAKVTIRDHDLEASGIFYFNETGEITHFTTDERYMTLGDEYHQKKWTGYFRNYQKINDTKIPTDLEVKWHLDVEEFSYVKFNISEIEYF